MNIKSSIGKCTVYASDYCVLDSDVMRGGGTDETHIIQAILDKATEWGSLHLVMDGAALISGITVHSNTTIECLNSSCGFYLKDNSSTEIIRNSNLSVKEITTHNITLKGGTYNHNCMNQSMEIPKEYALPEGLIGVDSNHAMRFFGVENFKMTDVTICDQKRYAFFMGNWKNVFIENVYLNLININDGTCQDGLHFYAPGENLVIRNCYGRSGDDMVAINTDEGDRVSSVSGVLIDGLFLDQSHQAVRLLCRERGSLENVTIRNVSGTYRGYGFYINPWYRGNQVSEDFEGTSGTFKNILVENVSLKQADNPYTYNEAFGFCLGGTIENIVLKNISFESAEEEFRAITVREGHGRLSHKYGFGISPTYIKNLTVDGLNVTDGNKSDKPKRWMEHEGVTCVENYVLKNVFAETSAPTEAFMYIEKGSEIKKLDASDINVKGFDKFMKEYEK